MKVSLIVLTFNEIEGMKAMMPRVKKDWYDELVIADGGSTDGTIEYAKEHDYFIFVQKETGAGAAFLEAIGKVTGDVAILFAPDGNFIPEKIPELINKMKEGYDIAMVSRYRDGAKSYDDDLVTAFGNKMFTGLINLLFRTRLTDVLYGYCAFRKGLIDELKITTKTPSCVVQLLIRAHKKKSKIIEIPGDEPARIGGIRKMQPLRHGLYLLKMITKELFIHSY